MRDILCEETSRVIDEKKAQKKYNTCMAISYGSIALAVLWVIIFIYTCDFSKMHPDIIVMFIFEILFWVLPLAIFIVLAIVFRKIGKKSYAEYDYSFVSGEVRIAKIPRNGYRQGVMRFHSASIDRIGKVGSETFESLSHLPGVKKIKLTVNANSSNSKDLFYMFVRTEGEKKLLIFDCSEIFISNVLRSTNARTVLEKDYK